MKKRRKLMLLMSCMGMTCNAQSIQSSTDVKPIAPKGYILFTEAGARAALADNIELGAAKRKLVVKDSVIVVLAEKAAALELIDKEQQAIIRRQRNQNFWTNVKMYGGYVIAAATLIFCK